MAAKRSRGTLESYPGTIPGLTSHVRDHSVLDRFDTFSVMTTTTDTKSILTDMSTIVEFVDSIEADAHTSKLGGLLTAAPYVLDRDGKKATHAT